MVFTTEGFFESNYRKLASVGFEPTTTEFRSDALTECVYMCIFMCVYGHVTNFEGNTYN